MTPTKPPASVWCTRTSDCFVRNKSEVSRWIKQGWVMDRYNLHVASPATRMAKLDNLEREALEAAMGGFADKSEEYLRWAERHDLYRIRPLARLELARRGEKKARKR